MDSEGVECTRVVESQIIVLASSAMVAGDIVGFRASIQRSSALCRGCEQAKPRSLHRRHLLGHEPSSQTHWKGSVRNHSRAKLREVTCLGLHFRVSTELAFDIVQYARLLPYATRLKSRPQSIWSRHGGHNEQCPRECSEAQWTSWVSTLVAPPSPKRSVPAYALRADWPIKSSTHSAVAAAEPGTGQAEAPSRTQSQSYRTQCDLSQRRPRATKLSAGSPDQDACKGMSTTQLSHHAWDRRKSACH